jgi:Erv1 / Alr family
MAHSPKEWGPHLWRLLHTTAECIGVQTHTLLKKDEANYWSFVLAALPDIMPCQLCQKHYKEWMKAHPPVAFRSLEGQALRTTARMWLWELHNTVNIRNAAPIFPAESIEATYPAVSPQEFKQMLNTVTEKTGVKGEPMRKFRKCYLLLLKLINKL